MSVFLSRIGLVTIRNTTAKKIWNSLSEFISPKESSLLQKNDLFCTTWSMSLRNLSNDSIQPTAALENAALPLKKKIIHKKPAIEEVSKKEGHFLTLAYATANSYDLKSLKEALVQQKLYEPGTIRAHEESDVVVANAVYSVGSEPREIIFFREGAVVFWNCTDLEASNVLEFVRPYEIESYPRDVVEKEREIMTYVYNPHAKKCYLQESTFVLVPNRDNSLERYTFSHAMVQSARLGAWEARLGALAAAVRAHSRAMETRGDARVDKKEVVRKLGELFSLRHRLTVESDLLDTPDFYWEEEQLERLYSNTVAYFTIPRRTRVLNERLSHCVELLELLSSWAADRHHIRLEWMIIVLILGEVCFELMHFLQRSIMKRIESSLVIHDSVSRQNVVDTVTYKKCYLQESTFVLVPDRDNSLERYTFSHAMVQSARLGAWEARLGALAAAVRAHSRAMETRGDARVDKKEVVRKLGELFSLRHRLTVESDLLDTPDFYWEEEQLERLYSNTVAYFTIPRRTRVLNERLSHCVELLELLSSWAADRHHIRLEWMIIVLILGEVCFELMHFLQRYTAERDV